MFSTLHSFLIVLGAAGFWTLIGLPFARRLLPGPLAAFAAPALGWALHSALVLPIHRLIGFTPVSVWAACLTALAGAIVFLWTAPRAQTPYPRGFLIGAMLAAAVISLCVAIAIAPKFDAGAVLLSPSIFDHSKVAMIDEMARLGVPPGNPFQGGQSALAYYYLWHFSAAELVLAAGLNGWEADAALAAFSAYASLMLMMGLSVWLSGRASAAYWVPLLALAGSLRPILEFLLGKTALYYVIWPATGFAGWFFQATWVPQHIASATCVVLAIILLAELARKPSPLLLLTFVLTIVAGYESSTWIGGITFAFSAAAAGLVLLVRMPPPDRPRFIAWSIAGAIAAFALAAPFLIGQYESSVARGVGSPVAFHHYDVLGEFFPEPLRRILDVPAYWLVFLFIEFPAIYPAGLITMSALLRSKFSDPQRTSTVLALAALTAASLMTAWLLASTLAENNDLGWRAVLPAVMVLTAFAAAGLARWVAARATIAMALASVLLLAGLPDGALNVRDNAFGRANHTGLEFNHQPELWSRVRALTAPDERVGNNPMAFADMTPWPVNIAWALFSNRRSCYAGNELALAYVAATRSQRLAVDTEFLKLFSGSGSPAAARDAAEKYQCKVVVVLPRDGAWTNDPFKNSPYYNLVEQDSGAWRIYRATGAK